MSEREYDVLLVVDISKVVRIKARSAKEARRLALSPDANDGEGLPFTENVGYERVADVVRADEPWHHDRKRAAVPVSTGRTERDADRG